MVLMPPTGTRCGHSCFNGARGRIQVLVSNRFLAADYTFDCIGIRQTAEQNRASLPAAVALARRRAAQRTQSGIFANDTVELNPGDLLVNEKNFVGSIGGSCAPDHDFPRFLDWHSSGDLDLHAMVTARYPTLIKSIKLLQR